jgi:iron complex outermembrane recepter protein
MRSSHQARTSIFASTSILALAFTASAFAQEKAAAEASPGDIIVTASKRAQNLQDVPFSIAAQTEAQIRSSGATNIAELSRNVAGLFVADLGPGQSTVSIRGGSSGQVVRDESSRKSAVAVYLDETDVSLSLFTPDLELFDLNRVEVLRGPQGTLFGAGAAGGVVRYITNAPKFDALSGTGEVSFGSIKDGGNQYSAKAAINAPVITDTLAVRAVGYYDKLGGFIDGINQQGAIAKDVNSGKKYGGRVAATFKAGDTITVTPRIVYQKLETNGFPRGDIYNLFRNPFTTTRAPGTFDGRQQFKQSREGIDDKFLLGDMTINAELGPVTLTSVTGYMNRKVNVYRDTAQLAGQIDEVLIGAVGSATLDAPLLDATKVRSYSQELRFASNDKTSPLQYVVGGFYNKQNKTYGQTLAVPGIINRFFPGTPGAVAAPLSNNPDNLFLSNFDIKFRQYALFGEANYDIGDMLTATAGVRYVNYTERRNAVLTGFYNCGSTNDCATPANLRLRSTKDNAFNPRVMVSFKPTEDVTLNVQASKGIRLGGINDPLITAICQTEIAALGNTDIERFKSEKNTNYEAGIKSQFLDRRLTFNASAYVSEIRDLQVSVRLPCSSTIIVNVPKARSSGLDAEITATPIENLQFSVGFAYNNSKVKTAVPIVNIRVGDQLPASPKYTANASIGYAHPVSEGIDAFFNFNVQAVSGSYSFLLDQRTGVAPNVFPIRYGRAAGSPQSVAFNTKLAGYALSNLRVGFKAAEKWEFSIYANNLFDVNAQLALDRERGGEGRLAYLRNTPRTIGASLRASF